MAGILTISTLSDGTNSTSSTNCIQGSAKAWVNFNGTGTVAIRGSYNVSSVTDNGTGSYAVNFTTALANANYAVVSGISESGVGGVPRVAVGDGYTAASFPMFTYNTSVATDYKFIAVSVFR